MITAAPRDSAARGPVPTRPRRAVRSARTVRRRHRARRALRPVRALGRPARAPAGPVRLRRARLPRRRGPRRNPRRMRRAERPPRRPGSRPARGRSPLQLLRRRSPAGGPAWEPGSCSPRWRGRGAARSRPCSRRRRAAAGSSSGTASHRCARIRRRQPGRGPWTPGARPASSPAPCEAGAAKDGRPSDSRAAPVGVEGGARSGGARQAQWPSPPVTRRPPRPRAPGPGPRSCPVRPRRGGREAPRAAPGRR